MNLEKSFVLSSSQYIKEICDPILLPIGITYFNYIKIHNNDCSREILTNQPEWIDHFYKNSLYNSVGAIDVEHLLPKGYFLWSEMDEKDVIYKQGRDFFNIDNGITFVIKRKETTLLFIFATHKGNDAINTFYASNIDLLQRFIHYFTNEGNALIKEASENRIYLPSAQNINNDRINKIILSEKTRNAFLDKTQVSKYYLLNESDDLYLTRKQSEYAILMINGLSAKQIARKKNVSHRTVEGHQYDIKNKLQNCLKTSLTKEQIIQILRSANIK